MKSQDNGLRRAAILILSLPTRTAAMLMSKLSSRQVEAISIEIAKTETVGGEEQESTINSFLSSKTSALDASNGGFDLAKELIRKAMGKDADKILGNIQQSIESLPFAFVKDVDPQTLLTFIREEHPQTIALLLSHLPSNFGAEVLSGLDPEQQLEVIQRVATIGNKNPDAIAEFERGLELRLSTMVSGSNDKVGGIESVAEILNVSERSVERNIMDTLSREDPELMDEIRRLMFVFEDIIKLSDRDVQSLLKNVETSQWALALKGSSDALQDKVMKNMSARAAENLKEEMEYLGSVRVADVESTQQKIVDVIRHLEDTGELARPTGEEEEEYVN